MKKTAVFISIFVMLFCLNIAQGAVKKGVKIMQKENVSAKRYDIKTAQVEYVIKGDFAHGKKTLIFTDWGMRESDTEQQEGATTKSITITDGDFDYAFATGDKDGYKSKNDRPTWYSNSGIAYSAWLAESFDKQGFEKTGTRIIAGKKCDTFKHVINKMTMCVWNGIPLYMETSTPDGKQKGITEAVKVNENTTIAKDAFTPPANIKF